MFHPKSKKAGNIVAIIIYGVCFYLANKLPTWQLYWLKDSYHDVLWIINLTLIFGLVSNLFYLIFDLAWLRHLLHVILNAIALVGMYLIYRVFPLNFYSDNFNIEVKIFMILIMVALAICVLTEFPAIFKKEDGDGVG